MLEQRLQHKLLQKLSPQQIQLIKLLELPTIELEQRIKKELEENPILEEGKQDEEIGYEKEDNEDNEDKVNDEYDDEFSVEDYINDDDAPAYKLKINNFSKDDKRVDIPFSEGISLHEYLLDQLTLRALTERQKMLAKYIIGNIDETGYIRRKTESIVDDLAFTMNISASDEEMNEIIKIVQTFDPAGTGARNLKESLSLQIKRKSNNNKNYKNAYKIIDEYFDEFSKKHYTKIAQKIGINKKELKKAVDLIIKLNPKPGSAFSGSINKTSQHIIPDFILEIVDGYFVISLNSRNVPELKISRTYSDMLKTFRNKKRKKTKREKNTITFVKHKLDSAKWFIDAIKQRQNTLIMTMNAIIKYQEKYFNEGDESLMRPMILKNIAEITGLDISTISRVANSKYIQTHFGIFPLKYFFSEGMENQDGVQVSTREIKKILRECIDNEDKQKPMTDEKLSEILKEKGYKIARRTVAKYREQLGIIVARLRKEL